MSTDRVIATWGPVVLRTSRMLVAEVNQVAVPVAPLLGYGGDLVLELRGPRSQRAAFLRAATDSTDPGVVHSEGRRDVLVVPAEWARRVLEGWLAPEVPPEAVDGWVAVRHRRFWRLVPVRGGAGDSAAAINAGWPINLDPGRWTPRDPVTVTWADGHTVPGIRVPADRWTDVVWSAVLRDTDRRAEGHLPPLRGPIHPFNPPKTPPHWELGPLQEGARSAWRSILWPGLVNGRDVRWWVTAEPTGVQIAYDTRGTGIWHLRIREDGLTWDPPAADPRWGSVTGRVLTRAEGWALCQLGFFWPLDPVANAWRATARRIGQLVQDPHELWWGEEPCQQSGWHGVSPRFGWAVHWNEGAEPPAEVPVWALEEPDERGAADALMWSTATGRGTLFCYASGEVEIGGAGGRVVVVPETRSIFLADR